MRAGGRDQRAPFGRRIAKQRANFPYLGHRLAHVRVDSRRRLEDGGHQLLAHALVAGSLGNLVEARHELVALGGDELELLLDADGERCGPAEGVLHTVQIAARGGGHVVDTREPR